MNASASNRPSLSRHAPTSSAADSRILSHLESGASGASRRTAINTRAVVVASLGIAALGLAALLLFWPRSSPRPAAPADRASPASLTPDADATAGAGLIIEDTDDTLGGNVAQPLAQPDVSRPTVATVENTPASTENVPANNVVAALSKVADPRPSRAGTRASAAGARSTATSAAGEERLISSLERLISSNQPSSAAAGASRPDRSGTPARTQTMDELVREINAREGRDQRTTTAALDRIDPRLQSTRSARVVARVRRQFAECAPGTTLKGYDCMQKVCAANRISTAQCDLIIRQ